MQYTTLQFNWLWTNLCTARLFAFLSQMSRVPRPIMLYESRISLILLQMRLGYASLPRLLLFFSFLLSLFVSPSARSLFFLNEEHVRFSRFFIIVVHCLQVAWLPNDKWKPVKECLPLTILQLEHKWLSSSAVNVSALFEDSSLQQRRHASFALDTSEIRFDLVDFAGGTLLVSVPYG